MGGRSSQIIKVLIALVAVNPGITRLRAESSQPGLSFYAAAASTADSIPVVSSTDSLSNEDQKAVTLPGFELQGSRPFTMRERNDGTVTVSSDHAKQGLRMLGEADLLMQLRHSGGISTPSDYSAGLSIDGMDASQTDYLIDGAPVIYPFRFGGIFSTFNTGHFRSATLRRNGMAEDIPKLGSTVDFRPRLRLKPGAECDISVGMTASSATILFSAGKWQTAISARLSYIDRIYKPLLRNQSSALGYSFSDLNLTARYNPTPNDMFRLSLFLSADNISYDDDHYGMGTSIKWGNAMFNMRYEHQGPLEMEGNIWGSYFHNSLDLDMSALKLEGPSGLGSGGARYSISGNINERWRWKGGANAVIYKVTPQYASLIIEGSDPTGSNVNPNTSYFADLFGRLEWTPIPENLQLAFSLKGGGVKPGGLILDPLLEADWHTDFCDLSLSAGGFSQFMHRVGFSELGLSSDFWIASGKEAPVERGWRLTAGAEKDIIPGIRFSLRGYWAKVRNIPEYRGQILEIINEDYNVNDYLLITSGHNAGISAALRRDRGPVSGSIQYSFGLTRRHLPGQPSFRGVTSPGHSLLVNAQWDIDSHWLLSGMFCLHSGRPYTPVKTLYLIAGNIAMEYGERNSARLPLYHRLDVGASYNFTSGRARKLRHQLSLSLINAYGQRNVEMQYFIISGDGGEYFLKRLYSLYRFLPSVSYSIRF